MNLGGAVDISISQEVVFDSRETLGNPNTVAIYPTDSSDSSSLASTETAVSWLPRGITGNLIQALGPYAVQSVEKRRIKKRLSSIGSQVDFRLSCSSQDFFSEQETKSYRTAYDDLSNLSKPIYKVFIASQALSLRLRLLKALILSETSILDDVWYRRTARKLFEDLDDLSINFTDPSTRNCVQSLRMLLVDKLALEIVDNNRISSPASGPIMSGIKIVSLFCNDLAYGHGSYSVQYALLRISRQYWGHDELLRIGQEGNTIVECVRRLLINFDNPYSSAMAFRIFGSLPDIKVISILSGPDGTGRLVNLFRRTRVLLGDRDFRATCVALDAACCGYAEAIVTPTFLSNLKDRLQFMNNYDIEVWRTLEEEEVECIDNQQAHVALCYLMANLTRNETARIALIQAGITRHFRKFCIHTNRWFSPWRMRHSMSQALERLEE